MKKIVSALVNPTVGANTVCAVKGCENQADNTVLGLLHKGLWSNNPRIGNFQPICHQCATEAGYIKVNSPLACKLGFISTHFSGNLWLQEKTIFINMLNVPFELKEYEEEMYYKFLRQILMNDYHIRLMNASLAMEKAADKIGYTKHTGIDTYFKIPYSYYQLSCSGNKKAMI